MKIIFIFLIIVVTIYLSVNLGVASADVSSFRISATAPNQLVWQDANEYCLEEMDSAKLPTIFELVAIAWFRDDIELVKSTDYWSATAIAGWAFGYNTKSRILSFDRINDDDHFLCIGLGRQ